MALFEQIYETIWQEILSGSIKFDEKLKDTEWAARTGASRTPVREALRALVRDGILRQREAGGFALRRITAPEIADLYHYRAALEAAALSATGSQAPGYDLDKLTACIATANDGLEHRNYKAVLEANSRFHALLLAPCRNRYLNDALNTVQRMVMFARLSVLNTTSLANAANYEQSLKEDQADHSAILAHIAKNDFDTAATVLRAHIIRTGDDMATLIDAG